MEKWMPNGQEMQVIRECWLNQPFYRLSAVFDTYRGISFANLKGENKDMAIDTLCAELDRLPFKSRNFIFDNEVHADWYPPFPLIPNTAEDFVKLIHNFELFLGTIDFTKGKFNPYSLYDSPGYLSGEERFFIEHFEITASVGRSILSLKEA